MNSKIGKLYRHKFHGWIVLLVEYVEEDCGDYVETYYNVVIDDQMGVVYEAQLEEYEELK